MKPAAIPRAALGVRAAGCLLASLAWTACGPTEVRPPPAPTASAAGPVQVAVPTAVPGAVKVPDGWEVETWSEPGVEGFLAREDSGNPEDSADLYWLRLATYGAVDLEAAIDGMAAAFGWGELDTVERRAAERVREVAVAGEYSGGAARAVFFGRAQIDGVELFVFAAPAERFEVLGGRELPVEVFGLAEVSRELGLATARQRVSLNTVLAEADGRKLTERMVADTIAFGEYLAVSHFTPEERLRLRATAVEEFSGSDETYQGYLDIVQLMGELADRRGRSRTELRRQLMTRIHFDLQSTDEPSPLMDVVYGYNPILGADAELDLVVTAAAYGALLDSNGFICEQAGLPPISDEQRAGYIDELPGRLATLSDKDKQLLSEGEDRWANLIDIWRLWSPDDRARQLRLAGVSNLKELDQVPGAARNLEALAGIEMSSRRALALVEIQGQIMALDHWRGLLNSK